MIRFVSSFFLPLLCTLALAQGAPSAQAEDLRCEIIFAGASASVAAEAEALESDANILRFAFGGFLQCASPASAGFKSFADSSASDRQVVITLSPGNGARNIVEQRLKDCHRQALLAMSNPGRYVFSLAVANVQLAVNQNQSAITANADSATSVGCSLGANATGLK